MCIYYRLNIILSWFIYLLDFNTKYRLNYQNKYNITYSGYRVIEHIKLLSVKYVELICCLKTIIFSKKNVSDL